MARVLAGGASSRAFSLSAFLALFRADFVRLAMFRYAFVFLSRW